MIFEGGFLLMFGTIGLKGISLGSTGYPRHRIWVLGMGLWALVGCVYSFADVRRMLTIDTNSFIAEA